MAKKDKITVQEQK